MHCTADETKPHIMKAKGLDYLFDFQSQFEIRV